jgi:SAM-dependent methyltransferase
MVISKTIEAKPHSPVYTMHKYFARRPWNVFRELVSHYTAPGELILDPFCGGGVTVIESLRLKRKVVGVDVNPIAAYVTRMEAIEVDVEALRIAFSQLARIVKQKILSFYATSCPKCHSGSFADWIEWDETTKHILRIKYDCIVCGSSGVKAGQERDSKLTADINDQFDSRVSEEVLWFRTAKVPPGDKTSSLLSQNINYFYELYTKRNLLALAILKKKIENIHHQRARAFLDFTFSSSLKWASKQCHLRGEIVEGWAMHAYWLYPKTLEINVWNTFERRFDAVLRGKKYGNREIGSYCKLTDRFENLIKGTSTCMILNRSSTDLSLIPNNCIDSVITDPPYGGNVNYGELADYWYVWLNKGETLDKTNEIIVNKTQGKALLDYESMLHAVMSECYRVLKPNCRLVSTFNSRDSRVVASFVIAACRAGFSLHSDGLVYQPPIRAYTTTFHAMAIGAFVGDFVFTFVKEDITSPMMAPASQQLQELKSYITDLIDSSIKGEHSELQIREQAYKALIPFLSASCVTDLDSCREAVDFFEKQMKKHDDHFSQLRKKVTEKRIKAFKANGGRRYGSG